MCGRYYVPPPEESDDMQELIEILNRCDPAVKTGEIRPGDKAPAVMAINGQVEPGALRWNSNGINARAESSSQKSTFAYSAGHFRVLLPCSGFYEWKKTGRSSTKYFCKPCESGIAYLGGLYLPQTDGFVVLTREAEGAMRSIHDRMPVFIPKSRHEEWLLGGNDMYNVLWPSWRPELELRAEEPEQLSLF